MRTERQVQKLIAWLDQWKGCSVAIAHYNDDFERLVLVLRRPDYASVDISLFHPTYISGPFSWQNCQFVLEYHPGENDLDPEFILADQTAGFVLRFGGPVAVGDGGLVVPSD